MEDQCNQLLLRPSNFHAEDGTQKTQTLPPTYEDDCFIYYEKYAPSLHPDNKDGDIPAVNQDDKNCANPRQTCIITVVKVMFFIIVAYSVYHFMFD